MKGTKPISKRLLTLFLAVIMLITSLPLDVLAETNTKKINYDENPISDSGFKEGYINNKDIDVKIAKPENGTKEFIDGPVIPDIYTLKVEYKIQRGDRQINNYQPYEASVGEKIKDEDKKKIKQTINLPEFDGYTAPTPTHEYEVTHEGIIKKAKEANHKDVVKKEGPKKWTEHKGVWPYVYTGTRNKLKVKHIFQTLEDRNKYGPMEGQAEAIETTETGLTGSIVTISPLEKEKIKGFEPERNVIETQMPEHTEGYVVEYRYNRKHFNVSYDTKDGLPIATRTIYYGQRIPKIPLVDEKGDITTDQNADPTYKLGSDFLGWKPSVDLKTKGGKTYNEGEIIKDSNDKPVKTLNLDFIMPAENITFTAEWKDKPKADYAVQFWAEKADHADNASLLEKYDYIGTNVYKNKDTGTRPDLDNEPIKGIPFPDLDKARLEKIWKGPMVYDKNAPNDALFNRAQNLLLNKFYVYNKSLTADQNKDPKDARLVKSVSSTGKTVYNIYFDRQVYDLYFTQSNDLAKREPQKTFYPEVYKFDEKQEKAVKVGGPGNPYHFKARFNQLMLDWPNDGMQIKGFTSGNNSHGWSPNMDVPWWDYRDTPPYRLSADQFLDFPDYDRFGGYTKKIDAGAGKTIDANDFRTLSFGIEQYNDSIPHHMDFWMDGFKDGETIIRYDLYRSKADTSGLYYGHKYTVVQGFTPYGFTGTDFKQYPTVRTRMVDEDELEELNDERDGITPIPDKKYKDIFGFKHKVGQLNFILAFFDNADSYGDVKDGKPFKENGYLRYKYTRNKYPLRFNYDPSKIKADNEFNNTNSLETFYNFPLKVLSPNLVKNLTKEEKKEGKKPEYFKDNPANYLDNPENLQKLGLTDLVFTDKDGKLKVKRPENLPDQMEFKGWALDPAGTKLVWENKDEKMPNHALNLYAKWGEPDFKWKVTVDPNGGSLYKIRPEELTKEIKTIQEGDIGNEETKTYPEKLPNEDKKQIFTVIQRQQLNEPKNHPRRQGYDFLGWEWVRFDENGNEDKSYYDEYKVPELYSFGNDVVSDVYLRAIWVKNDLQTVMAYHHILDKDLNEIEESPEPQELPKRRIGYTVAALGSKQGAEYTLVPRAQWEDLKQKNKKFENYYDEKTGRTNNYFQVHRIEGPNGEKPDDFRFFYMPYRKREYKVNYLDERCRADVEKFITEAKAKFQKDYKLIKDSSKTEDEKREAYRALVKKNSDEFQKIVSKYSIIDAETVINGKRHYDARNYRHIPGWTLADNESPQQQLFFDVDESTNEFLGINGTGLGEIFFFYQDARAIEVKNPNDDVPEGYVRVTFKIDEDKKGGVFKDKDNNEVTEIYYDVIKGLKWDSLPVPGELGTKQDGSPNAKEEGKYYITPDSGKSFLKWDNKPLLNKGTVLQTAPNDYYVFTAYFDWSGLTASGMVRTEAYKDPNGKWTNDFAPTIKDLKKQLVWKEREQVKPIPDGTDIKLVYKDKGGTEKVLTKDEEIFDLVKEMNIDDATETVRVVNIVAKVTFKGGKQTQELPIPITVYKNRYEALNINGDKPEYLTKAENTEAKDGGLKDILKDNIENRYIKVTIKPNKDFDNKDNKVYYVNPNAWVEIPEIKTDGDSNFTNWTANVDAQNEEGKENGIFDFKKRHMFTEDTIITPVGAKDVVEQEGKDKPDVPKTYVKVIVKTTDNATDETKFEKTFWVNPTKDVTIPVANPTGKTVAADPAKPGTVGYTMNFFKWETEDKAKTWENKIVGKFENETTIIAKYSVEFEKIKDNEPKGKVDVPQGKTPSADEIKDKITPPEGKTIKTVTIVENPNVNTPGESIVKVIVEYTDGSSVGTNDNPIEVPVKVHEPIVKADPLGNKPEEAMENYVKVIFKAGEGGTVSGDLVYYVSPEVEVDMTESAGKVTKTPSIGYTSNGGTWSPEIKAEKIIAEITYEFNFVKSEDIVEKTDNPGQVIPEGYVKVTFKTEDENKGKIDVDKLEKIYYVNPTAGIKLGKTATADNKTLVVPTPTANTNYVFDKWQEAIDETTPITSERIHVAIFQDGKVKLTYDKGGTDVTGNVPAETEVKVGTKVRLANADGLSKENTTFAGWKIGETTYQPGQEITLNENTTAIAQWSAAKHTVKFIIADGAQFAQEEVEHGKTATKPTTDPKLDGKVFMGWKENESDENYFDFTTPITADKTLIAIWQDPVQKIGENDTVDSEKFIKVTFKKGDHGKLKIGEENPESLSYKVQKGIDIGTAIKKGMTIPQIIADNYYKVVDANNGWDKTRDLTLEEGKTEKIFTAQYELKENVVPVDKTKDNETLKNEKPDDMVLVTFEVDPDKAILAGNTKFYVKKSEIVNIDPPVVLPKVDDYVFEGWKNVGTDGKLIREKFDTDETIKDTEKAGLELIITSPKAGYDEVDIKKLIGTKGKLIVTSGASSTEYTNTKYTRRR